MASKIELARREAVASGLLEQHVSYTVVVDRIRSEFSVSARTAKRTIERVYARWREDSDGVSEERIRQAVRNAERMLRRLAITKEGASGYLSMNDYRRSQEIRNWETHLLKLSGVFLGRTDKLAELASVELVLAVPAWGNEGEA